ncbi:MAG: hypothetical protein BRC43_11400 [Cyanobacteria bacterium QS_3_48_167]|jgi:hypothetical protein|nr:MAG: hypothetical protein BRC43_11400 [Cyanobacteria bacterium QS_3_48_167]
MEISELNYLEAACETSDIYGSQDDGILNSQNAAALENLQDNSSSANQDAGNGLLGLNINVVPQTNASVPVQAVVDAI